MMSKRHVDHLSPSGSGGSENGDRVLAAPVLSVVAADLGDDSSLVSQTVRSMLAQSNQAWELIIVGQQPADIDTDPRVSVLPFAGPTSEAWRLGLARCTGSYVMVLDTGSSLASGAVEILVDEMEHHVSEPDANAPDLFYGDEDVVTESGDRDHGFYKPSYSPERLRVQDYIGEAAVYRRELVNHIGGLDPTFGQWARYDLTLRVAEHAETVVHIPAILTHQFAQPPRGDADTELSAVMAADVVQAHLNRTRFPAQAVGDQQVPGCNGRRQSAVARLAPRLTEYPQVSVIIPTGGSSRVVRGRRQRLIDLILSSMAMTDYPNYETVVVFDRNSSRELQTSVAELMADRAHSLVQDHRSFNYSQACNLGAARSSGDVFVFLNDDTEIVNADWMSRLVMFATRPRIGAVGVKLLYEDGRLQHTGVWARDGHVAHRYAGFASDQPGVRGSLMIQQNCSAVTGACLAIERTKFEHVGGFCTALPLAFNDVDLCFKLQMAGYRSVIDGDNIVVHLESSSRNPSTHQWELDHLHHRWRPVMYFDPYDNPNNTGRDCDEFPPTPPEMADARWAKRQIQRKGRIWQREPITMTEPTAAVASSSGHQP